MTTSRKGHTGALGRLAALAAGAIAIACAAPRPVYRTTAEPFVFTVDQDVDDKKCPKVAEVDFRNCDPAYKPNDPHQPRDCLRAKGGQQVVFVSRAGRDFELQFDPFGSTAIAAKGGKTEPLTLQRPTFSGASKPHTFSVRTAGCPAVDPEIIVDW